MNRTRTLRALVATAAVALTATACNANPSQDSGSTGFHKGGTLTIYSSSDEQSFDPAKSQSLAITSQGLVHRRLTTWDIEKGKEPRVVPDLATDTGKATDGGRTWTYTLKPGLKLLRRLADHLPGHQVRPRAVLRAGAVRRPRLPQDPARRW